MSDLISRQAAIDVARKCSVKEVTPAYMLIDKVEVMTELMMLPSAQPTQPNTPNTLEALDCISRQKAVDAFDCMDELIVGGRANAQNVMNYINKVIGKIKALPSAQPEIVRCKDCKYQDKGEKK